MEVREKGQSISIKLAPSETKLKTDFEFYFSSLLYTQYNKVQIENSAWLQRLNSK